MRKITLSFLVLFFIFGGILLPNKDLIQAQTSASQNDEGIILTLIHKFGSVMREFLLFFTQKLKAPKSVPVSSQPSMYLPTATIEKIFMKGVATYEDGEYEVLVTDQDGLSRITINDFDGNRIITDAPEGANPSCPVSVNYKKLVLKEENFPLTVVVVDCKERTTSQNIQIQKP
jgi:hypothetical protein